MQWRERRISEISTAFRDVFSATTLSHPAENRLFVGFDFFGSLQYFTGDGARNTQDTMEVHLSKVRRHQDALRVETIGAPPDGPQVIISQPWGRRGPTSFRLTTTEERNLKQSPSPADAKVNDGKYWKRDRDLGQTFTTPDGQPFRLDAISVRVGPSGFGKFNHGGAPGARVSLQIMRVFGTARVHDNATITGTVSKGYPNEPRADDYITGESYEHVMVAHGGVLPERLELGGLMWTPTATFCSTSKGNPFERIEHLGKATVK